MAVPVRNGIDDVALCQGDVRVLEVVESRGRLILQVCLGLGGGLGQQVLSIRRDKQGSDPALRWARMADQLCLEGRLQTNCRPARRRRPPSG